MSEAVPAKQKALLLHKESTPYAIGEIPVQTPGPTDVLVKVVAAALNPVDANIVDPPFSRMFIREWPYVPGSDGAGVVVELGAEVTNLKKGDKILFQGEWNARGATCQQYTVVPADLTAKIPDNISFEEASTIPVALLTNILVTYNQSPAKENLGLRLKPFWKSEGASEYAGTPAFIVGGAGSVGQFAIQVAKLAGHSPIIATASPHNAPLLTSLGATHVVDRSRSNASILAELPTLTGGKPIPFAFVTVMAPDALALGLDALAPGGALATVLANPAQAPPTLTTPPDGKRVGFVLASGRFPWMREAAVELFQQVTGWLEKGLIKPNPIEVLPNGLAGVNEGLQRMKAYKVSAKKLVTLPQETA